MGLIPRGDGGVLSAALPTYHRRTSVGLPKYRRSHVHAGAYGYSGSRVSLLQRTSCNWNTLEYLRVVVGLQILKDGILCMNCSHSDLARLT